MIGAKSMVYIKNGDDKNFDKSRKINKAIHNSIIKHQNGASVRHTIKEYNPKL